MLDFTLERDAWQQLVLVWKDGRRVPGVEPVRAFPISAPEGFLSICDADGHVLIRVNDFGELPAEVRTMLEEELSRREFVPIVSRIGGRQPAFCTGVGKALLAFLAQERLDDVLPRIKFEAYTPTTVRDIERLVAELAVVRARGYALDNEEHEPGISCVAFPIFDLYAEPIASISATTSARKLSDKLDFYIESVQSVSNDISRAFGHRT